MSNLSNHCHFFLQVSVRLLILLSFHLNCFAQEHLAVPNETDKSTCTDELHASLDLPQEVEENTNTLLALVSAWQGQDLPEGDCIHSDLNKTTKELSQDFLIKLNSLFKTNVKYNFISKVSAIAFSADVETESINFPNSYLNKVCAGAATINEMYFILAHEYAHILIESHDFNLDMAISDKIKKEENDMSEDFDTLIHEMSHINTDSIAAKILKHFDLPIDDGAKWISSFKNLMPAAKDYHIYWENRPAEIRKSYSEGGKRFTNYYKIFPICTIEKLKVLAESEEFFKDMESSGGEDLLSDYNGEIPKNCITYSKKDFDSSVSQWQDLISGK